jgi:hypothetical protein
MAMKQHVLISNPTALEYPREHLKQVSGLITPANLWDSLPSNGDYQTKSFPAMD